MSHTNTTLASSPQQSNPPSSIRSPSPPPSLPRATSQPPAPSPASPTAASRFTSPPPEPAARETTVRERTPAPAAPLSTPSVSDTDAPEELASDVGDEEFEQENVIDLETFNQILDLDEDDTHDFSLGMTEAYFTQASTTFKEMDAAFESKDLPKLSSLGHFLKGSSAALGVSAVQATCEDIQHYGALRDEVNGTDLTKPDALAKIDPLLKRVKREYAIAERWLQTWYKKHVVPAEV